jgi:hypothetical protein
MRRPDTFRLLLFSFLYIVPLLEFGAGGGGTRLIETLLSAGSPPPQTFGGR